MCVDIKCNRAACVGPLGRPRVRECLERASRSGREGSRERMKVDGRIVTADCSALYQLCDCRQVP